MGDGGKVFLRIVVCVRLFVMEITTTTGEEKRKNSSGYGEKKQNHLFKVSFVIV
jgi:hypothetical protein